jgi:uncharacterized delta-60 repeat protein
VEGNLKRKPLLSFWRYPIALIISLNLLSCGSSNGGGGGASGTSNSKLDPNFGTDGIVTTGIGTSDDEAFALASQSDGKLVAAGYSNNGSGKVISLARYTRNGALDTTFGTGGKVTTAIGGADDEALALAIQSDGKLVIAGQSWNGSQLIFALVRYNTDGSLDTTFNSTGIVTTAIGTVEDITFALKIQSDGKLVAAGISKNGAQYRIALVRYNTDGSLDTTFNSTGIVITTIGTIDDEACALAIQSDGKLVTAGYSNNGTQNVLALVRYNTDGSLDTTFGTGGKVTTAVGNDDDGEGVAIQSDGKIVATGTTNNGAQFVIALARFNSDGTLDTTFNTTGMVITAIGSDNYGKALVIQSNGKLVVTGYSNNGTQNTFDLVRYNPDGNLDTTFNSTGIMTTAIGTIDDEAFALAIQSDGKPVAAGYSDNGTQKEFALVRYEP